MSAIEKIIEDAGRDDYASYPSDIEAAKSELVELRQQVEGWKKRYYDVADAVAAESKSCEDLCTMARATRTDRDHYREVVKELVEAGPKARAICERNGYVFKTPADMPYDERDRGEKWELLAFTFYTNLWEISEKANALLARCEGEK